ncbi:MAG: hypothetical protein AB4426_00150 [Xenococcaceae cyanobacterium]
MDTIKVNCEDKATGTRLTTSLLRRALKGKRQKAKGKSRERGRGNRQQATGNRQHLCPTT